MKNIYAVSDIHSHLQIFKNNKPNNIDKLFILGDFFNKGIEQKETIKWIIDNAQNPKYIFIIGNHEVRVMSELVTFFQIKDKIFEDANKVVIRKTNRDSNDFINMTKIIIKGIQSREYSLRNIVESFTSFKWFDKIKIKENEWILSHASWIPFFKDLNSITFKQNCVYDKINLYNALIQKRNSIVNKYVQYCIDHNIYHVFGHNPISHVNNGRIGIHFNYIDSKVYKTKNINFFKLF